MEHAPDRAVRAFVAVVPPPPTRKSIARLIEPLRGHGDVRWTDPDQLHFTIRFLGAVSTHQLTDLEDRLRRITDACLRFRVGLDRIGAFPSLRRPRIVWLGVSVGSEEFVALAQKVTHGSSCIGKPPEDRPWTPHLTVGRVRSPRGVTALVGRLGTLDLGRLEPFEVQEVVLMESQLRASGAEYRVAATLPLGRSSLTVGI